MFSLITNTLMIVSISNITLERPGSVYGQLRSEGIALVTILDFENDIHMDELVDVQVYGKRRRDDILHQHMRQ